MTARYEMTKAGLEGQNKCEMKFGLILYYYGSIFWW
jgi:hypothetical protein